ncbi:ribonuclease D [Haloferula chungangensis]|uniref:Ribonuclease D n=2 Tax=Haloferula chungangensis TaxID=1048331 RepID=A0ABW2L2F7_9BACT
MIDSLEGLAGLLNGLSPGTVCAIDTEADSLHRYKESLCLIQFAVGEASVLIDPLALEHMAPLGEFLKTATVWMHGADYDMTMLRREFDEIPPLVFDTQIGARLLGVRKFGLANLVEHYFGVVLSKTSQKADWGKRPLSPKMTEYALNDVRYLLPMGEKIVAELREKGRYEWFVESCDAARQKVLDRDESKEEPWRVQGAGRLDRKGLHYLRALWNWRDAEAESWDRPSFMVATNRNILEWSGVLASGNRVEFPGHFRADRRRRLESAISEAGKAEASSYPTRIKGLRRRRDSDFEQKVNEMLAVRDKKAAELDIDSSLIASRAVIEALAIGGETSEGLLLNWQKECLGFE